MKFIIEMDPPRAAVKRSYATEEEIRENQRLNRLQREKEQRAYQNDNNSTSSNGQVTQDKDKSQDKLRLQYPPASELFTPQHSFLHKRALTFHNPPR